MSIVRPGRQTRSCVAAFRSLQFCVSIRLNRLSALRTCGDADPGRLASFCQAVRSAHDLGISLALVTPAMVLAIAFRPPAVGLDIGRAASKPWRCGAAAPGWSLVAAGEMPSGRGRSGCCRASRSPVSDAIRQVLDRLSAAPGAGRRRAVGPRRHRQAAVAARDEPGGAGRSDSVGGRAVHPL